MENKKIKIHLTPEEKNILIKALAWSGGGDFEYIMIKLYSDDWLDYKDLEYVYFSLIDFCDFYKINKNQLIFRLGEYLYEVTHGEGESFEF